MGKSERRVVPIEIEDGVIASGHHRYHALAAAAQRKQRIQAMEKEPIMMKIREYLVARTIAEIILVHTVMAQESPEILAALGDQLGAGIMEEALGEVLTIVKGMPKTQVEFTRILEQYQAQARTAFTATISDPGVLKKLLDGLDSLTSQE